MPHQAVGWFCLLMLTAAVTGALWWVRMPAATLLGPMLAAIAIGLSGQHLSLPKPAFSASQAIIGCLVAHAFTPRFVETLARNGLLMLAVVLVTVAAGALVGIALTRWRILPGASAAWGSSPGGAAAMVAMADAYGADVRLVAFMQYVRVALVVLVATLVTRLHITAEGSAAPAAVADTGFGSVLATLAVAGLGAGVAMRLRVPSGAMLGPMVLGALLHGAGLAQMQVPTMLLDLAYATVGWVVGLRFTRETLAATLRALPAVLAATLALIGLCAVWAWGLTHLLGIDFLTAFLATSPGGLDSVAVIAVGSHADIGFVLSVQTLRLFVVLLTGPPLARWIARTAHAGP